MLKLLSLLLLTYLLLGCISNKTPRESFYYLLDAAPMKEHNSTAGASKELTKTYIKLSTVRVPDYLQQSNLVLKLDNHQIKIANYHFWAQDLSESIQRVLMRELNAASPGVIYTQQCVKCAELIVSIDHFYPTQSGDVVLSGTYTKVSVNKSQQQVRFLLNSRLEKGGYDEAVVVMRDLVSKLALEMGTLKSSY